MGYVISLGSGLVLGIVLLCWALRERSKRHDAELKLEAARATATGLRRDLKDVEGTIVGLQEEGDAREGQLVVLRDTVNKLRVKLRECRDPATVRAWLDDALGSGEL